MGLFSFQVDLPYLGLETSCGEAHLPRNCTIPRIAVNFPMLVGGVHQRGEDGGAAGGQGTPRPSDVQRGDVPVVDGLLTSGLGGDGVEGKGVFYEAFAVAAH
jgi:hypothetical protein